MALVLGVMELICTLVEGYYTDIKKTAKLHSADACAKL